MIERKFYGALMYHTSSTLAQYRSGLVRYRGKLVRVYLSLYRYSLFDVSIHISTTDESLKGICHNNFPNKLQS